MTCQTCHSTSECTAVCPYCLAEVSECDEWGEPVKSRPVIENVIADVRQLSAPVQQSIKRAESMGYGKVVKA